MIVGRKGSAGEVNRVDGPFWPSDVAYYTEHDATKLDFDFFHYGMLTLDIPSLAKGVKPGINRNEAYALSFPIPPLEEQKRIVAVLDTAFEGLTRAKENAEANLQNARELFELTRDASFYGKGGNWRSTTVGQVCDRVEYGTSLKSLKTGKMPVLRMGNIQRDELDWGDLVFTDDDEDIRKLRLRSGDVLFNRTNSAEHVGKTAIYRGERAAIFAGYLIRLHYKADEVDGEYLNLYLNGTTAREHGKSVMSRSVNQANINGTKLKQYPIRLPSVGEQWEIANRLRQLRASLDKVKQDYRTKLTGIADLRQSLLQKAFAGELT